MGIVYTPGVEIVPHPDWLGVVTDVSTDLAMIKLNTPITDVETYGITKEEPIVNLTGKIVGYGFSVANDPGTMGIHRVGDTTIQRFLWDTVFELGDPASICSGDSGGPFLVDQDDNYNVMGVASFGLVADCPADHDGYFVNLYPFRRWINDAMVDLVGHGIDLGTEPDAGTDPEPVADSGPSAAGSSSGGAIPGPLIPYDGGVIPRSGGSSGCKVTLGSNKSSLLDRILLVSF
jgi:hypothetical protein